MYPFPHSTAPPHTHSVGSTLIGRPTIPTIAVRARVEEHTDAAKVLVFKKKRRTVRFPIIIFYYAHCVFYNGLVFMKGRARACLHQHPSLGFAGCFTWSERIVIACAMNGNGKSWIREAEFVRESMLKYEVCRARVPRICFRCACACVSVCMSLCVAHSFRVSILDSLSSCAHAGIQTNERIPCAAHGASHHWH